MFRTQNLCPGSKNVFHSRQKYFLFPSSKICFRNTRFLRKLRNICIRNNVSPTMFPSLARPLGVLSFSSPVDLDSEKLANEKTKAGCGAIKAILGFRDFTRLLEFLMEREKPISQLWRGSLWKHILKLSNASCL